MSTSLETHIARLSSALSKLAATGADGFEGLIAVALGVITGTPFRLASSGYQRGIDGKAAFEGGVAFEGKLYTNTLPRNDVLSKIPDLVRHNEHADIVWVLGATCGVRTQLADDLRADGAKEGVSVLILDWIPADFPRLAVALAMGGGEVNDFLKAHLKSTKASKEASAALAAIRAAPHFPSHEADVRSRLDAPGIATAMAEKANAAWFEEILSDKALARSELGQPLALKDETATVLGRGDIVNAMSSSLFGSPDGDVVFVHGEEGCGKSWVVVQSWLAQSDKPLLVFAEPDDFPETPKQGDIEDVLIAKLIAQTGDLENDENAMRWRRRLRAWKDSDKPSRPRLVLIIDGINQRPGRSWGRTIDHANTYLARRGGRVVVTSRTHFKTQVKKALNSSVEEVTVHKWNASERDEILRRHNIPLHSLYPSVAEFLSNPRILSIALQVFGDDVATFEELSVDRLLFEHIRAGVKEDFGEDPNDFNAQLREQAKDLLKRATSPVRDGLRIFDNEVPAVAEGRFYRAVPGEPRRYELRDEGLTLALGLSLIENLRKAGQYGRSVDDTLKEVLGPVEALDKTAEAMTVAITVCAADDDEYSPEIAHALVKGFADLQNPPSDSLAVLVSFVKARPLVLAEATRDLSLQGGQQPNFDWIQAALVEAATSNAVWTSVAPEVQRWLRAYTLAPERGMHHHGHQEPPDKVAQDREKSQAKIDGNVAALSSTEKARLGRLVSTEGDLDALSRLAFSLLAGKELTPFADALADWSFSNALNGSFWTPDDDFHALVGLNRRDWTSAHSALLLASKDLSTNGASRTGKWARLRILRATGDPDDDREASILVKELTKDRRPPSLSNAEVVIEPCDPSAAEPIGLDDLLTSYRSISVDGLRQGMWRTEPDRAFVDDRPVVARFALEVAVAKHRAFADDVMNRTGTPLRQGLIELREHGALLTEEQARALFAKWRTAEEAGDDQGLEKDERTLLEYELLLAFPFLDAAEQIDAMLATTEDQPLLLELLNETKTPDAQTLGRFVLEAITSGADYKKHLLLEIAATTGAALTDKTRDFARAMISSKTQRLRSGALGLAARCGDPDLLRAVAESDWKSSADDEESFESWYGSLALLKAAQAGLIDDGAALERISPRLYGRALTMIKGSEGREIARRIDASIRCAAGLPDELVAPEIELEADGVASDEPIRFSVSERETPSNDIRDFFKRLSESNEEFRHRQNRNHDAFKAFTKELTTAKARIVLDSLTIEEFAAAVTADPAAAESWGDLFMELNHTKLPAVHNLILLLAGAMAGIDPAKSAALFERTVNSRPLVRFTFGKSGIDLGSKSAWTGPNSPPLDALRKRRLDGAPTDQALAVEVASALLCGHERFLDAYVDERLARPEPAEIARGIMVAGFSQLSPRTEEILARYRDTVGLPGKAYAAAIAAYRSDGWARHWFKVMCETDDSVEFWQAGILFVQCVDGRFLTWGDNFKRSGGPIAAFGTSLNNPLKRRYGKLGEEREKCLFGQNAPAPIFVKPIE